MDNLPILPLRNSVLFPAMVVPVNVGRSRSLRLIDQAFSSERPTIGVVAQRRQDIEDPGFPDLYTLGTLARVLKVIRLSSGNYSVVLQGVARIRLTEPTEREPYLKANAIRIFDVPDRDVETLALAAQLRVVVRDLLRVLPQVPREVTGTLENVQDPGALADLATAHLPFGIPGKQLVLETHDVRARLRKVIELVGRQIEVYRIKKDISIMVQEDMSASAREVLLRQQMRSIREELGEADDEESDVEQLRTKLARASLPPEAERAAKKQLSRMRSMAQSSAEYQVARTYVEWFSDLPWNYGAPDRLDVAEVRRVLDEDHYGLTNIKQRIIEYIAVRKLRRDKRGPILCFIGPPGVGKTSLGRSIARSTGRPFVRISLGGVHDESEIRGHRRTYVGALPGRIVTGLKKAGAKNPVFVLDEIDKLGSDYRGDPSSAMLEVLDPEQNSAFVDHYIEVPVDLSNVMFIATANRKDTIPGPLLDRMELIELPGYTYEEKQSIARQFLIPKQLEEHGLTPDRLEFTDEGIAMMIEQYTHEAGVRNLQREVASMCRAIAVRVSQGEDVRAIADPAFIEATLGAPKYEKTQAEKKLRPGVSTGLMWSAAGGDLLMVESSRMPGTGQIHLTGQMGGIMKESVATAFTYLRTRAGLFGQPDNFLSTMDVHVHVSRASSQRDTASVGLAVLVSLASMLTRLRVRSEIGMTGEITLRGHILSVNGIKEKFLAAHRAGLTEIILPERNRADLDEVPEKVRGQLKVHFVSKVEDVIPLVLDMKSAMNESTSVQAQV